MRQYELTYLISDDVAESDLNKITGNVGGLVAEKEGKLIKEEIWGRRKLAYPINKQQFATYVTVNFDLPPENINDFEREIKSDSKIIRHLLIIKEFGEEKLVLTKEDIAETKELKEVAGGEKSFEAIEGETEESRDLMAKRKEKEKEDAASAESGASVSAGASLDGGAPASTESGMRGKAEKPEVESKKTRTKDVEKIITKKEAKPTKKNIDKEKKIDDEVERLSKLDKELDDILGKDL